jgi:hypothetical protein
MARTPSMTPQEAETILGARGNLNVNSENRGTVRKWIVAQGFPALFVAGLSMRELGLAYNQTDGKGLDAIRHKLAETLANGDAEAVQPLDAPVQEHVPAQAGNAPKDAATLLRELLLQGYTPGIDENRVRAIVQESIAGVAPRVIEIRHDDKPPIKIEGLVHPEFERALGYLSQKGPNGYRTNVMLVGPAGCGKSHMIAQLATALGVDHTIVGGTAGATEGDLIGRLLPGDGGRFEYVPSKFVQLYEQGNALLGFDEIDGFDPNMLMMANMPLANGHMYVHIRKDNPCVTRGENVFFIATANTFGTGANPMYVGRNPMDEATRDRFIFISVDYDHRLEESIAAAGGLSAAEMAGIWELRDRCREAQLRRVISTRAFQKAAIMKARGESWREIRDRLLEGWSKDEKAKVGV